MAEHVTFFRMKVKPGKVDDLVAMMNGEEPALAAKGWQSTIAGRSKDDANIVWICVTWDTSERYYKNAESPEQNASYERMRAFLESDPEWFDCDLVSEQSA
jgi:heme-degrading monooxygenase HmoA